jgi:hypothetical protein
MRGCQTVAVWTLAVYFLVLTEFSQAQNLPASGKTKISALSITQTPEIRALCLPGTGDAKAYGESMTALVRYTNAHSIKTAGFIFSDNWKQGPDPKDPGTGARWDVCVESAEPDAVAIEPFLFEDLKPRDAAYGSCESMPDDLPECFAGLESFAQEKKLYPVAPPRYKIKMVDNNSRKNVYEIWLPTAPPPPQPPPKVEPEPAK